MHDESVLSDWLDLVRWIVAEHPGRPGDGDSPLSLKMNRLFLDALCGPARGTFEQSVEQLSRYAEESGTDRDVAVFFLKALYEIPEEIEKYAIRSSGFAEAIRRVSAALRSEEPLSPDDRADLCWIVFFPEGLHIRGREGKAVKELRRRRQVTITGLPRRPIVDPSTEILFTANALLTVPLREEQLLSVPEPLRDDVKAACLEKQRYWYDHPVPVGADPENNEIIYGLRGLDDALAFERDRGNLSDDWRVPCLLSLSVTHEGLHAVAKDWIEGELSRHPLKHLDVYVITEDDTDRLVDEILLAAGEQFIGSSPGEYLRDVFGVDGEYGRHYSLLKAVAVLYAVLVDSRVRATFKIDLDQVFPQDKLVRETGRSAFEHLASPLWGAFGRDEQGREVELGMIAGALVNDGDTGRSLFTPDVIFPDNPPSYDELVFFSRLPQALSTEAEMMARYDGNPLDGETICLQRIHVTGGTNGILLESLRRHRPFTPTFIGRAEDQAWLLSALLPGEPYLRYLHQSGLFMRHDKESFAAEAVRASAMGKLVGDYGRIIMFSRYASMLPWPVEKTKEQVDPFTGCFISAIPLTVTVLRLSLKAQRLCDEGDVDGADELLRLASARLLPLLDAGMEEELKERYEREQACWHWYYDILEEFESRCSRGEGDAARLKEKGAAIFRSCLVNR